MLSFSVISFSVVCVVLFFVEDTPICFASPAVCFSYLSFAVFLFFSCLKCIMSIYISTGNMARDSIRKSGKKKWRGLKEERRTTGFLQILKL